jgi:hypothetical protein
MHFVGVVSRLVVLVQIPLEIAQHRAPLLALVVQQVLRRDRNFSAAARRVDHVRRDREAARVSAQALHDLEAFRDRRAEVIRAAHRIALIEVVRPHAQLHQALAERLDRRDGVVDAFQEHRLVVERDPGARELVASRGGIRRELARMVEVDVDPQRMIFREHRAQLVVDALRQRHRHAAPDADDLEVRDRAQLREDLLQLRVRVIERIAARHDDVANLGSPRDVVDHAVELDVGRGAFVHRALARAVAAVDRAVVRDHHQHAVGIAVRDAGHRRELLLAERILLTHRAKEIFLRERHDLTQDRIVGIVLVDQRQVVGRDAHAEVAQDFRAVLPFLRRHLEVLRQGFERRDAIAELPAPIVPVGVGDFGVILRPAEPWHAQSWRWASVDLHGEGLSGPTKRSDVGDGAWRRCRARERCVAQKATAVPRRRRAA